MKDPLADIIDEVRAETAASGVCSGCGREFDSTTVVDGKCPLCRRPAGNRTVNRVVEAAPLDGLDPAEEKERMDATGLALRELARRELMRRHLLPLVEAFVGGYEAGWVHRDICERLERFSEQVAARESPRLMLFMPPRHGKSTLATQCFPAWHLGRNPGHEIMVCSYSYDLAKSFSKAAMAICLDKKYGAAFQSLRLDDKSRAVDHWRTTQRGGYIATGVGGTLTGKGAHCLIIDDPVKNREEADSPTTRNSTWEWYRSTAYTRLAPGGGVLVIQTRWHEDDLSGRLLGSEDLDVPEEWEIVKYPAIAEKDEEHRPEGEALHPNRFPVESLARIEAAVGPREWAAQYQQNPVPDAGLYFTESDFKSYEAATVNNRSMRILTAWDLAISTSTEADYSVGVTVGLASNGSVYVLDLVRARWRAEEIVTAMLDMQMTWNALRVGLEAGQIEMAITPLLHRMRSERAACGERALWGMRVESLRREGDKALRARALQGMAQQGRVYLPSDRPWVPLLKNELLRFPVARYDDQVDALAWAAQMVQTERAPEGEAEVNTREGARIRKLLWKAKRQWKRRNTRVEGRSAMKA